MPVVVIVGFGYQGKDTLTSTLSDIYVVYSFYRDLGYPVYICSDIDQPEIPKGTLDLLTHKKVDEKFMGFIQYTFKQEAQYVASHDSLLEYLSNISSFDELGDRKVLFYFTGHGVPEGIVLPDNSLMSSIELRNAILNIGSRHNVKLDSIGSQIFIIMDCCNPHGLYLPFCFSREFNEYRQVSNLMVCPQILLIASSDPSGVVSAHHTLSSFTDALISRVRDVKATYCVVDLLNYIDKITNGVSAAHTSYPTLYTPWAWLVTNKLDININESIDALIVNRLNK